MADNDQKTESPTDKRKRDSVQKGDVVQSRDLATAMVMLAGVGWLKLFGTATMAAMTALMTDGMRFGAADIATFDPAAVVKRQLMIVAMPLAALLVLTIIAAVGATAMTGSLGFRGSALGFKGSRIDPMAGIKRIFGKQGLVELVKAIAKVGLLGGIGLWLLNSQLRLFPALAKTDLAQATAMIGGAFVDAIVWLTLGLAIIAMIDVPAQIMTRMQRLRMTKQEVRDEHKQSEGSPESKAAIRRAQHAIMSGSTRKAIAEATVILTNPTHFAVALRYRPGIDTAPVVVARGADVVADAIRALATDHAVPMLSYPQLTRAIYFTSRTGQVIRDDLFIAVATILAFIFNLDAQLAARNAPPLVDVPPAARFDSDGKIAP